MSQVPQNLETVAAAPLGSILGVIGALLGIVAIPSTTMAYNEYSMAAGVFAVATLILAGSLLVPSRRTYIPFSNAVFRGIGIAIGLIAAHGAVARVIYEAFDDNRFWQSLLLFAVMLIGAAVAAMQSSRVEDAKFDRAVRAVFWILAATGVAAVAGVSPFYAERYSKQVFFFMEPSHFTLALTPFLLYTVARSSGRRRIVLVLAAAMLATVLQSLTLLFGVLIVLLATMSFARVLLLAPLVLLFAWFAAGDEREYYLSRLTFSQQGGNLSVMSYLQGWERAIANTMETNGFGVGFQQFGIVGSRGEIQEEFVRLGVEGLNLFDGGTVASKLIGEFGVLGLGIVVVFVALWWRVGKRMRLEEGRVGIESQRVLAWSVVFSFGIDMFARGTGYFSSSGFLFAASACWLIASPRSGSGWNRFEAKRT